MLRDWNNLKDVLLASAIILVLVASRADGQVHAALLTRSVPPETERAIVALEESREALLEARDAVDAALRRVDEALASLGEDPPRERLLARAREAAPARVPSLDDLDALWSAAAAFSAGLADGFAPWRSVLRGTERISGGGPAAAGAPALETAAFAGAARPEPAAEPESAGPAPAVADSVARALPDPAPALPDPAPALPDPAPGTLPAGLEVPGTIIDAIDAAGAILRALDDARARASGSAPGPEDPPPPAGRDPALPAEAGVRRADR